MKKFPFIFYKSRQQQFQQQKQNSIKFGLFSVLKFILHLLNSYILKSFYYSQAPFIKSEINFQEEKMQKYRQQNRNSNMRYTSDVEAPGSIKKQLFNKALLASIEAPKDSYGNIQKLQLHSPSSAANGNFISFRNASHLQASQQKSKGESFTLLTQAQNLRRITPTTAGSNHQKIAGNFMQHTAASKQKLNLEKSAGKYDMGKMNPQVVEVKKISSMGTHGAQITVQPVKQIGNRCSRQSATSEGKYVPVKTQKYMRQQNERNNKSRQNSDIYEEANKTMGFNSSITSSGLRCKSSYLNTNSKAKTALLNKTPVTPSNLEKTQSSFNAYNESTLKNARDKQKNGFRSTSQRKESTSTPMIQKPQDRSYLSKKVSLMSQNYFKSIEKERNQKRSMKNVGNYRTQYLAQDSNGATIISSQPSERINSALGSSKKQAWDQTEAAEKKRDQEARSKRMELGRQYLQANRSNSRAAQRTKQSVTPTKSASRQEIHVGSVEIEEEQEKSSKREMKQKLRFLYSKLGAVIKGYKARRIYHNNKAIRKYRYEFRDLIQFAYSLKQDISYLQSQRNSDMQVEQTKQLLLTSLKDLVQKRLQFMSHFDKLYHGLDSPSKHNQSASQYNSVRSCKPEVEWILESKPKFIQIGGLAQSSSSHNTLNNSVQSINNDSSAITPERKQRMSNYKKQFINVSKEGIDLQASIYKEESNSRPSHHNQKVNKYLTFGVNTNATITRNGSQAKNLVQNNLTSESMEQVSALNIQDQENQEVLRRSNMSQKSNEKSRFRRDNVSQPRNGLRHEKSHELINQAPLQNYSSMLANNNTKSFQMLNINECRDQLIEEQNAKQPESPVEKHEFLKKGQGKRSTSRINYDPRKSILEEQMKRQQSQERQAAVDNKPERSLTRISSKPQQPEPEQVQQPPSRQMERLQVHKSTEVPVSVQKDTTKRSSSFISKIPRLSKSIQRDCKATRAVQNNDDDLKQEIKHLRPMKSASDLKNVKSRYMAWATPTKNHQKDDNTNLRNINDQIRASNQNYVQNLSNKNSARKSNNPSANRVKETLANIQTQVTNFAQYDRHEDKIQINDVSQEHNSGARMRSRAGSNNSRLVAGHPVAVNTRYHKKTFSNVSGLSQLIQNEPEDNEPEEQIEELKVKQHSRSPPKVKKLASPVRHQIKGASPKRLQKKAVESPGPNYYQNDSDDDGSDISPSKRITQIMARFSPLKNANFENQYIQKRNNKSVGATSSLPQKIHHTPHETQKVVQEKGFVDFQTLLNQKKQQRELDQAMNGVKKVSCGISALSPIKGFQRQKTANVVMSPEKSENDFQSPKRMNVTSFHDMSNHSPSVTSPNVIKGACHPESPDRGSAYGDRIGKLEKKLEMIVCDSSDRNRPQIAEINMFDQSKRCLNLDLSSGFNSCQNSAALSNVFKNKIAETKSTNNNHLQSFSSQNQAFGINAIQTQDLQDTHSSFRIQPQTIHNSSQIRSGHYSTQEIPQFLESGPVEVQHNELTEMISPSILNPMCSESPTKAQNTPMNHRKESRECIEGTPLVSNPHIIYPGGKSDNAGAVKDRRRSRGDRTKSQRSQQKMLPNTHKSSFIEQQSNNNISQFTEATPQKDNVRGHNKVLSNAFQVKQPSVFSNGPYVPVIQQQTPNRFVASSAKKSRGQSGHLKSDSYSAQRMLRTQQRVDQRLNQNKKSHQQSAEKNANPGNTAAQIQSAIDVLMKQKNEGKIPGLDAIIQTLQNQRDQMMQLEN